MHLAGSLVLWLLLTLAAYPAARGDDVDFTRDVRPILVRHCFKCHGPDDKARQGELRLDIREEALKGGGSGEKAIVPGKPDESDLVRRILSDDETEVMPPPTAKLPLTPAQKAILKAWVAKGAMYVPHWAFVPPKQAPVPKVRKADWPLNPIDHFVLAKMEELGLAPAPAADKYTLVRRLYLDLIGMPPTVEEADAFVNDRATDAYDQLVDRLLKSPHYGERWGRKWLDLARYADTNGYEKDRARVIWPYRDWVINAINSDMPFDQFTIEQIAGDLLPGATVEQRIATGFHRNTMLNEEGGIDPLEFRFYAMTDRVATTGTAWLGLTIGCCQCHTHKYDPIAHREYYQLMAFLNNADEPVMDIPQPDIVEARAAVEKKINQAIDDLPNRFPLEGDYRWQVIAPATVTSAGGATLTKLEDGSVRLSGENPEKDTYTVIIESNLPKIEALRIEALTDPQLPSQGPGRTPHGNFVLSELAVAVGPRDGAEPAKEVKLASPIADFSQEGFPAAHAIDRLANTGWAIHGPGNWNVTRTMTIQFDRPVIGTGPLRWTIKLEQQHGMQHTLGKFRISLGQRVDDPRPEEVRRRDHLERKLAAWIDRETKGLVKWTVLRPVVARANLPILTVLDDDSVLASSDQTKRDVYDLKFKTGLKGITAIRLEAIPDDRLPGRGSGRVYYEGPIGDFYLSNITLSRPTDGRSNSPARRRRLQREKTRLPQRSTTTSSRAGQSTADNVTRSPPSSIWLSPWLKDGVSLDLQMVFGEKYFACGLGGGSGFRSRMTHGPSRPGRGSPCHRRNPAGFRRGADR